MNSLSPISQNQMKVDYLDDLIQLTLVVEIRFLCRCFSQDVEGVKEILDKGIVNPNILNHMGNFDDIHVLDHPEIVITAMKLVASLGYTEIMRLLLDSPQVDPTQWDDEGRY